MQKILQTCKIYIFLIPEPFQVPRGHFTEFFKKPEHPELRFWTTKWKGFLDCVVVVPFSQNKFFVLIARCLHNFTEASISVPKPYPPCKDDICLSLRDTCTPNLLITHSLTFFLPFLHLFYHFNFNFHSIFSLFSLFLQIFLFSLPPPHIFSPK